MATELIFILAVVFVLGGYYWFGNYYVWGKLSRKHKPQQRNTASSSINKSVNVGIRVNGKWAGSVYAQCYSDDSGLLLTANKYLKVFTPTIFLPWADIHDIQNTNNGFMGTSITEIKLKEDNVSISMPKSCDIQLPGI